MLRWAGYRQGDRYFHFPAEMKLGSVCIFYNPYDTVLNASRIGNNISCVHCTTLGYGRGGRPVIGDKVSIGVNVFFGVSILVTMLQLEREVL